MAESSTEPAAPADATDTAASWVMVTRTFAPTWYRAEDSGAAFLTDEVLAYISDRPSTPWFAHISYHAPHPPYIVPEPYHALYDPPEVPLPARHAGHGRSALRTRGDRHVHAR